MARLLSTIGFIASFITPATEAFAQQTRDEALAAEQAGKAAELHPYVPEPNERLLQKVSNFLTATPTFTPISEALSLEAGLP
jgi:hypothetical protein